MHRLAVPLVALLGLAPVERASAQGVRLEIRPRAGDTVHTKLEQEVEVTGTTKVDNVDSSVSAVSSMTLLSRTIVQRSDPGGTTVLTITDSVALSSTPPRIPASAQAQIERALRGQQIRLRIAPDGAAEVLDGSAAIASELQALVSMPPALPAGRIAVGGSWTHTMHLPAPGRPGLAGPVSLKTTFRLDSLSRGGRLAFVSMRGELTHDDQAEELPGGGRHRTMTGSIEGYLVVDRTRGWMTQSMSVLSVRSVIEAPPASGAEPMYVRMRVTQRMRTLDKR